MTQVLPERIVEKLAAEVTLRPDPPSEDLKMALEQLIYEVTTGEEPERPIDWAKEISQAVQSRHES